MKFRLGVLMKRRGFWNFWTFPRLVAIACGLNGSLGDMIKRKLEKDIRRKRIVDGHEFRMEEIDSSFICSFYYYF